MKQSNNQNKNRNQSADTDQMPNRRQTQPSQAGESAESMADNPLHEVFIDEIADVYSAENQLLKALPKMAKAAQSEELRAAFESHLEETQKHAERLEEVMTTLGETMKRKKCKAMEGLLEEGKEMMEDNEDEPTIDAVLIAAAQKVEHYEIASYGTLAAWARQMNHDDALELFNATLEEEKAADEKLTQIAESTANAKAEQQD